MEPSEPFEKPPSSATPALAFGIPAILILAALPFLRLGDGTSIPTLSLFLGRFHPTLLHLPVALLLLALAAGAIRLPRLERFAPSFPSIVLDSVLWLAALSGFAAALAGMAPVPRGGLRRGCSWTGTSGAGSPPAIGAFACVLLRSFAKVRPDRAGLQTPGHRPGGGHRRNDDLRRPRRGKPDPRRGLPHGACAGADPSPGGSSHPPRPLRWRCVTPIAERELFEGVALRIFESHCTSCHNPGKLKGDLRLDTYEGVLAGGQSGPVVVAGDPGASELLKRVHLPLEDKAHMPPKGKTPLTDDETAVLTWWIEAGLPKDGTLRARKAPAEIRVAFSRTLPEAERRAVEELQNRQASEYEATLAGLRAAVPGSLRAILPGERDLEYTAAIAGATFGDAELLKLGRRGAICSGSTSRARASRTRA